MYYHNYFNFLQSSPVTFTVMATVTESDINLSQTTLDFGQCTIHESVFTSIQLTNKSCLPQDFGFVHLPKVSIHANTVHACIHVQHACTCTCTCTCTILAIKLHVFHAYCCMLPLHVLTIYYCSSFASGCLYSQMMALVLYCLMKHFQLM